MINASFESLNPSDYQFGQAVDRTGTWGFDLAASVTAENNIMPLDGSRMMKFLRTFYNSTSGGDGDDWQAVSVGANESLTATGFVNRINRTDADKTMGIGIYAYSGSVSNFGTASPLASTLVTLITDSDVNSWEKISAHLVTPANTTYVGVILYTAREGSAHEFYGNYADNVSLIRDFASVPEPGACAMMMSMASGAFWLVRRRK